MNLLRMNFGDFFFIWVANVMEQLFYFRGSGWMNFNRVLSLTLRGRLKPSLSDASKSSESKSFSDNEPPTRFTRIGSPRFCVKKMRTKKLSSHGFLYICLCFMKYLPNSAQKYSLHNLLHQTMTMTLVRPGYLVPYILFALSQWMNICRERNCI